MACFPFSKVSVQRTCFEDGGIFKSTSSHASHPKLKQTKFLASANGGEKKSQNGCKHTTFITCKHTTFITWMFLCTPETRSKSIYLLNLQRLSHHYCQKFPTRCQSRFHMSVVSRLITKQPVCTRFLATQFSYPLVHRCIQKSHVNELDKYIHLQRTMLDLATKSINLNAKWKLSVPCRTYAADVSLQKPARQQL